MPLAGIKRESRVQSCIILSSEVATGVLTSRSRAITNPRVSEEAKEHAREAIKKLDEAGARRELESAPHKSEVRVEAGLKASVFSFPFALPFLLGHCSH